MKRAKSLNRTKRRVTETHSKVLYDTVVNYAYYLHKAKTKKERKKVFIEYSDKWAAYCLKNRHLKHVELNTSGFNNIANNPRKIKDLQQKLGLRPVKLSFWERIKSII